MIRIVVLGATGNVGTSVLDALSGQEDVEEIVGIARRRPLDCRWDRTRFATADIARDELDPLLRGADVVIHLAWLIQPGRDERITRAVNVEGSRRVFESAVRCGVRSIVYASSVGAYGRGPKDRLVSEDWVNTGIGSSFYSRHIPCPPGRRAARPGRPMPPGRSRASPAGSTWLSARP